jgi:hypothetical protein
MLVLSGDLYSKMTSRLHPNGNFIIKVLGSETLTRFLKSLRLDNVTSSST